MLFINKLGSFVSSQLVTEQVDLYAVRNFFKKLPLILEEEALLIEKHYDGTLFLSISVNQTNFHKFLYFSKYLFI
jgi:hypothetical protein